MENITLTLYDQNENEQIVRVEYLIQDGYVTYARILDELEIIPTHLDSDVFENIYLEENIKGLRMGCKVEVMKETKLNILWEQEI